MMVGYWRKYGAYLKYIMLAVSITDLSFVGYSLEAISDVETTIWNDPWI